MAETVEFASNGSTASGYLVKPASGSGPGVLVIQEWWGLDSGIKEMADRLGAAGFVALAPDLYHGELAAHDEMDKAAHLMQSLPPDRAGTRHERRGRLSCEPHGGHERRHRRRRASAWAGCWRSSSPPNRPDKVKAAVPFYGFPQGAMEPDWSKLTRAVQGHMAEHDNFFAPAAARALEAKLQAMGKDVTLTVHPGTGHAFMAPHNALGTLNPTVAAQIWPGVVSFLHETLG